jgi:hypothetical protein
MAFFRSITELTLKAGAALDVEATEAVVGAAAGDAVFFVAAAFFAAGTFFAWAFATGDDGSFATAFFAAGLVGTFFAATFSAGAAFLAALLADAASTTAPDLPKPT